MLLDLFIIAALTLFGYWGSKSGTLQQLAPWGGLALGRLAGKPLALILILALIPSVGFPPIAARVGVSVLCFYTFYILGTIIAGFFLKKFKKRRKRTRADRVGGCLLGLGQGGVVIFVLLSVLVFFDMIPVEFDSSTIIRVVRNHNLFGAAPLSALARVERLMEAARHPSSPQAAALDGDLQALLSDPKLADSLHSDVLLKAVESGDFATLKHDPRIAILLQDPRITGPLSDPLADGDSTP